MGASVFCLSGEENAPIRHLRCRRRRQIAERKRSKTDEVRLLLPFGTFLHQKSPDQYQSRMPSQESSWLGIY